MRSLRVRLVLGAALVAGLAVAALALFSREVVHHEYRRLVGKLPAAGLASVADALSERARNGASLPDVSALLERAAPAAGHALIVVDTAGRVVATSAAVLRGARAAFLPGDLFRLEGAPRGARAHGFLMELIRPEKLAVRGEAGRVVGTLVALPARGAATETSAPFLRDVNRGLWLGVALALALGLGVVWILSARIAGPIEALTAAARRMETGDLTPRVEPVGHDEVAALARSFNAMAEGLARQAQLRRRVGDDIAHELRTPLTNLRAQIEAMEDGLVPCDAAALRPLHEETMLLARLVDDLQELGRAESGTLGLARAPVPVRPALAAAAQAMRVRAAERGVELRVGVCDAPDLKADPGRLAQILRNLLANALTHTPAGGTITLGATGEGGMVAITVADTGEGIAAEHLEHVFDRFYRADPSRSRDTGGAGLGLAIVKRLAEAHGGGARAASAPGRGTTITVTLPSAR